jgi:hypothetical protein
MVGNRGILRVAVVAAGSTLVTLLALTPSGALAALPLEETFVFQANGSLLGTEAHTAVMFGELEYGSPEETEGGIGETVECATVGMGSVYNATESERINGDNGYGALFNWFASGHNPNPEGVVPHLERSAHCRLARHGTNLGTERSAWATAEPRLAESKIEAEVCINKSKKLSECANKNQRQTELLLTEVRRGAFTLPWELEEFEDKTSATVRTRVGVPNAEERAKGRKTCETFPSPNGCIKLQILVPELAVDNAFEGSVNPRDANGVKNALSPSTWFFEGRGHEPCLRLDTNTEKCLYTKGVLKIFGFQNQELIIVNRRPAGT